MYILKAQISFQIDETLQKVMCSQNRLIQPKNMQRFSVEFGGVGGKFRVAFNIGWSVFRGNGRIKRVG